MKWKKRGLIFEPRAQYDWVITHASTPFALYLSNDRYRIYFGGRNKENKTQQGYIEVKLQDSIKITYLSPKPVLRVGRPGLFDDSGVLAPWIVRHGELLYMYYTGWAQGVSVPYYAAIGLAISYDGGRTFKRYSRAPIMDRNDFDPYLTQAACVLKEENVWRMWYVSAKDFRVENGRPIYYYNIRYAESEDGIHWRREGITCIDFRYKGETRIGRPCVRKEDGIYKMWYSYAITSYRIGYAESEDGIHWKRKDEEAGIDVSESGWNSEMICYPFVFEHAGRKYMLYNGNSYGKTGFGYAILETE